MRSVKPLIIGATAALLALSAPDLASDAKAAGFSVKLQASVDAEQSAGIHKVRSKRRSRRRRRSRSSTRTASLPRSNATIGGRLFGTTETKSNNFKPFKKWRGAMKRMAAEQTNLARFKKKFKTWLPFLNGLKGKSKIFQINSVNRFMNQSRYILDLKNWGVNDYWASPGQFLAKFGDCEDYAIAKYMALKYLGHDIDKMRVVALKDLNLRIGHAILVVYRDNKILVLDNQIRFVIEANKIRHYAPVYSINEHNWWRHRAG